MIYRNTIGIDIPIDILVPYIQPFLLGFQANGIPNFRRIRLVNELYHRTVQIFHSTAHLIRPEEITPVHKLVQPQHQRHGWRDGRERLRTVETFSNVYAVRKPYGCLSYIFSSLIAQCPTHRLFLRYSKPAASLRQVDEQQLDIIFRAF